MTRHAGRVAIVNGGGSVGPGWGNGRCTAVQLAREGARVAVVDINGEAAAETVRLIEGEGGGAFVIEADATSAADMDRMVAATLDRWGRLDILAQIVGTGGRHGLFEESEAEWDRIMAINVKSVFLSARAALPLMIERGWGRIVTCSSIVGLRYVGKGVSMSYGASKAAVAALTRQLALEFADKGITCNCVAIGMIESPMSTLAFGDKAPQFNAMRDRASPTGKQGSGWDTARLIAFLASEEAAYLNGVELPLDGGFHAKVPDVYGQG